MRSQLTNTVVWITGASSGIGEALAYELSKRGANLILSARRTEALDRVKKNCSPKSNNIRTLPFDLANANSLQEITVRAIEFFGHVDILINNGGLGQRSFISDTTLETYRQLMEVNFFGTISLTKFMLPHFVHRRQGHFVTVSSITGKFGTPLRSGYAAAKHALHGFFDSLRAEQWQNNIYVTVICPGFIATNLSSSALTGPGSPQNHLDKTSYSKKTPEWCAKRIVRAIERKDEEVYIGGREVLGVYLKRFFPSLFSKIIRKVAVR
jgi:short-subunit dehydrogenase